MLPATEYEGRFLNDLGLLVMRLSLSILMLFHGIAKVVHGVAPIAGMLERLGVPGQLAGLVLLGEVVAPLLICLGIWSRLASLLVMATMVAAVLLAHAGDFLHLTRHGGWALELQAFYFCSALVLFLTGAGSLSLGRSGRWN